MLNDLIHHYRFHQTCKYIATYYVFAWLRILFYKNIFHIIQYRSKPQNKAVTFSQHTCDWMVSETWLIGLLMRFGHIFSPFSNHSVLTLNGKASSCQLYRIQTHFQNPCLLSVFFPAFFVSAVADPKLNPGKIQCNVNTENSLRFQNQKAIIGELVELADKNRINNE